MEAQPQLQFLLYRVILRFRGLHSWRDAYFGSSLTEARMQVEEELWDPGVVEIELLRSCPIHEWVRMESIQEVD